MVIDLCQKAHRCEVGIRENVSAWCYDWGQKAASCQDVERMREIN